MDTVSKYLKEDINEASKVYKSLADRIKRAKSTKDITAVLSDLKNDVGKEQIIDKMISQGAKEEEIDDVRAMLATSKPQAVKSVTKLVKSLEMRFKGQKWMQDLMGDVEVGGGPSGRETDPNNPDDLDIPNTLYQ